MAFGKRMFHCSNCTPGGIADQAPQQRETASCLPSAVSRHVAGARSSVELRAKKAPTQEQGAAGWTMCGVGARAAADFSIQPPCRWAAAAAPGGCRSPLRSRALRASMDRFSCGPGRAAREQNVDARTWRPRRRRHVCCGPDTPESAAAPTTDPIGHIVDQADAPVLDFERE